MFNPLIAPPADLKLPELENKISELSKKYWIAARSGNGHLCEQVLVALETYKSELQQRHLSSTKVPSNNGDIDLDGLINIS